MVKYFSEKRYVHNDTHHTFSFISYFRYACFIRKLLTPTLEVSVTSEDVAAVQHHFSFICRHLQLQPPPYPSCFTLLYYRVQNLYFAVWSFPAHDSNETTYQWLDVTSSSNMELYDGRVTLINKQCTYTGVPIIQYKAIIRYRYACIYAGFTGF